MSESPSETPLPHDLEEALIRAFSAPSEDRNKQCEDLEAAHPEHAAALRSRISEWIAEQRKEGTVTLDSDEHRFEWNEPPEFIGPYRILATLGSGGMGVVYLAEQKEPVRRDVAVKVIKLGMNSTEVLDRFEVERQALAMMNHPGIAKVFDAGVSAEGKPYFVMEYARGVSLSEFCDEHQLSVTGRIHIFQQICMAVQHAHQKGVLHRDLKPANILCTREGLQPVVKIIDFGLARATDQGTVARSLYTEQGKIIGTPEYMSPEQARGDAAAIDTRADIYSLGVILYQMLSGVLPFRSLELRSAGLLEVYRLIQEGDPGRPSSRVSVTDHGTALRAQNRRLSPTGLRKTLQGDLDWIVMKAMAKDPDRRYDSATALAMDLRRYQRHEPVEAGPPGAKYRFDRFLRRYRVQLLATSAVVAITVASLVVVWRYAIDATEQLVIATNANTRAASKEAEARAQGQLARSASEDASARGEAVRKLQRQVAKLIADASERDAELAMQTDRATRRGAVVNSQAAMLASLREKLAALELSGGRDAAQRKAIETSLADLTDLVLADRLHDSVRAVDTLHDEPGAEVESMQRWLRDAESIAAELPTVRRWIQVARKDGGSPRLARLRRLETELTQFSGPSGPLGRVRRESKWAKTVATLTTDGRAVRAAWKLARTSLGAADGAKASRLYAAVQIDLRPQSGLIPLGKNPSTGLWEFYHPRSAWASAGDGKPESVRIPPLATDSRRYRGELLPNAFPGIVFVLIPGRALNWKGERLKLAAFFLGKHELTQTQWLNLTGTVSPSEFQPGSDIGAHIVTGRHPVESVSWTQGRHALARFGMVLPTEVQWEYAAWGGTPRRDIRDADAFLKVGRRPAANVLDRTARGEFVGVPADFYDGYTIHAPVGKYPPNGFGLHDMLGNVEEWCLDAFGPYGRPAVPGTGERRETGSKTRVVRGGSYRVIADHALPGFRSKDRSENQSGARGLRAGRRLH
jgi:serine/threonine protein kinase